MPRCDRRRVEGPQRQAAAEARAQEKNTRGPHAVAHGVDGAEMDGPPDAIDAESR